MHDANGNWVGLGAGDIDPKITEIKDFMRRKFASYAGDLNKSPVYGPDLVAAVGEMQRRYGLPITGILDYNTQKRMGFLHQEPAVKPLVFSVEGHLSDMFHGPVADTATILEHEGVCRHQPIGYNNGAIPFDNGSGVNELARLFGQVNMDNGVPFPLGTPYVLAGYSQGAIVVTDFIANFLQPGQVHEPRAKECVGVLMYGNPCRNQGSVAPWSRAQAGPVENAGMDPYRRLDVLGIHTQYPIMDVYRKGDIFADNEPGNSGEVKSSVYEAVARGDFFSNPYSICAQIADLFTTPFDEIWGIFQAIVSGIGFLASGDHNPHYSPYDIGGGIDWTRGQLS